MIPEAICFKQLADDISPKLKLLSYFKAFTIQYFHTKSTTLDVFTIIYDFLLATDTWDLSKVVWEIMQQSHEKCLKYWNFTDIYKKCKAIKRSS